MAREATEVTYPYAANQRLHAAATQNTPSSSLLFVDVACSDIPVCHTPTPSNPLFQSLCVCIDITLNTISTIICRHFYDKNFLGKKWKIRKFSE